MKCKYCNTELKQGAKFCPNCGKEVLDNEICISCGEQIKIGAKFCPHCGANQEDVIEPTPQINSANAEQPQENNDFPVQHEETPIVTDSQEELVNTLPPYEKESRSKKWLWIIVAVLLLGVIGGYFFLNGNSMKSQPAIVDTDSIEEVVESEGTMDIHSVEGIKARLTEILAKGMSMPEEDAVKKYFSKEFQDIYIKVEDYDAKNIPEGEIGFWDFSLWGDGQGELNSFHFDVLEIHNVKASSALAIVDYISDELKNAKITTNINLVFENGNWLIDEITDKNALSYKKAMQEYLNNTNNDVSQDQGIITISQLRDGESIKDVLSSLEYRYKKVENDRGYVTVYWYKNCELDNQFEVIKPVSKNAIVIEEFDGQNASIRITVYDVNVYENLKKQIIQLSQKKNGDEYHFDWGDGEYTQNSVSLGGKSEYRDGGYYVDIPLW